MARFSKIVDKINRVDKLVCELMFGLMFVVALAQLVSRFVFHYSLGFSDELCRYLMIYFVFLAIPLALRQERLLRMEVFSSRLRAGTRAEWLYRMITLLLVAAFYLLAAVSALLMMRVNAGQLSPAMDLPMSVPYSAILIGGVLVALNCAVLLLAPYKDGGS